MNSDIIYYNLSLFNEGVRNIPAQLLDRRQSAIITNPEEYNCSIVRFTCDSFFPLFIPFIPDPAFPLQTDISITFTYLGIPYQQFVNVTPNEAKYGVFDFGLFLTDLNAASNAAFTAMKAANPGAPGQFYPYFALDPKTQLISMYVDIGWFDTLTPPNLIYFNQKLQNLLNLPATVYNVVPAPFGEDYQISVKGYSAVLPAAGSRSDYPYDISPLAATFIQVSQEFVQLAEFSDISTLMFTSNILPIVPELTPVTTASNQSQNTSNTYMPIITDFVITRSNSEPRSNSFLYLPTAEYRRLSLSGGSPVTGVDISAYFTTYGGKIYPLYLPPGGSMTLKLLFERKRTK